MLEITPVSPKFFATRSYGNNRYIVYSLKLKRELVLYSNLEYFYFLLLEFDKSVISFCEQPDLKISQMINGKTFRSVVDFIKEDNNGMTIIECKPSFELNEKRAMSQIQTQKEWAYANNIHHEVFTEKSIINQKIFLSNLKKLHTALMQYSSIQPLIKESVLSCLEENKNLTITNLIDFSYNTTKRNILPVIAKLYHEGSIDLSIIDSTISLYTEVTFNERQVKKI